MTGETEEGREGFLTGGIVKVFKSLRFGALPTPFLSSAVIEGLGGGEGRFVFHA